MDVVAEAVFDGDDAAVAGVRLAVEFVAADEFDCADGVAALGCAGAVDFSVRDFSIAGASGGIATGAGSAFAALPVLAGGAGGCTVGVLVSSSFKCSRRSRAPPGIVLLGSPNSPAG